MPPKKVLPFYEIIRKKECQLQLNKKKGFASIFAELNTKNFIFFLRQNKKAKLPFYLVVFIWMEYGYGYGFFFSIPKKTFFFFLEALPPSKTIRRPPNKNWHGEGLLMALGEQGPFVFFFFLFKRGLEKKYPLNKFSIKEKGIFFKAPYFFKNGCLTLFF